MGIGSIVRTFTNPFVDLARDTLSGAADALFSPLTEEARKAREQAERLAAQQRESLAALQAEPAPVIPIADEVAKAARKRSITEQLRRRGRASTILTSNSGPSDTLGA